MSEQEYEFQAEIRKLLDILSKSLYKHKEIFLRELISNAVDALKKIDFILLTNRDIEDPDEEKRIEIYFNPEENTLTLRDYGVGMAKEELINDLGTIAGSGTEKFLKKLQEMRDEEGEIDLDIIGQFGIGFYSVFMVAKEVKVRTKSYSKDEDAYEWTSDGTGQFTIQKIEKKKRGTDVILYLNEEDKDFLNEYRIENIIKKYSNFVPFPIYIFELEEGEIPETGKIKVEEEEEEEGEEEKKLEPINETQPLWKKDKNEITDDEYKEFYHYISNRYDDYLRVINYQVSGQVRFRSILYIPESATNDMLQPEEDYGLSLYSKNVMIMKYCKELIPQWMRFVKGVLESDEIPLNISRETIQSNRKLMKMSSLIVKKVIRELKDMAEDETETFLKFWDEFGRFIKEGVISDVARKDKLKDLIRIRTTKTEGDELIGLKDYVERMNENQEDIYYLVGEDLETMKASPHLGYYEQNDIEVILFHEPIDNFLMMNMEDYKIETGEGEEEEMEFIQFSPVDVSEEEKQEAEGEEEKEEKEEKELPEDLESFLKYVESLLGDKIMKAKTSERLYGSPCRLANPASGPSSSQQRAMRYYTQTISGQNFNIPKRIFEFNPDHPVVKQLVKIHNENPEDPKINPVITQLFENCLLSEGDLPNPAAMVPRINQLIELLIAENSED
jgi:molecular chaperone HtpG